MVDKASVNQWITVEPNTNYILSAYVKISDTSKRVVLGVNDSDNKKIESKDIYTGTYTRHEIAFETGSNTSVKVFVWLPPSDGATVKADQIELFKIPAGDIAVTGVSISSQTSPLFVDDKLTLIADVSPSIATNKNVGWKSDNSAVATVYNGVVTAEGIGTATITATTEDGGFIATTQVTVSPSSISTFLNGDFENGLNHWNTWQNVVASTSGAYDGTAAKLTGPASVNQTVTVEANTTYTFAGYVKVEDPQNASVVLGVDDMNKQNMANNYIDNTRYTYHEVTFTTGNNQTEVKVYLWRPQGAVQSAYLDNAILYETPTSGGRTTTLSLYPNQDEVQIYPNPSNGIITINASNWEGQKSVEIINILGQVVLQADVKDESTLSLTHLKKGTYLVRVTNELGNIKVKKIILK